jgi:uncharacterized protein DUF4388
VALEGTIKDFGLPDIFQLIGLQRKTGILTLNNEVEDVTVTFENGMVVMADSTTKRLEDRLGNVLVKQGKLSKEKLDEALQTQKATLQRLGHILTGNRAITEKDLRDALQVQVTQLVFKVFRWRDGEYHFDPAESVEYDRDYFSPMSAESILMEGVRMVDEWPIIEKKIPSMDIVFRPMIEAGSIEVVSDGEDAAAEKRGSPSSTKIRLTHQEDLIFRRVDGTRTVQAIIDATGFSEFETCRTLFDLLNRNLIATVGRGMARESAIDAEEPAASPRSGLAATAIIGLLALFGVLVRLSTPFAVTGLAPALQGSYEMALQGVTQARLQRMDQAIRGYHLLRGGLPRTLDEVASLGLADASCLRDPWARPFRYALTEDGYRLSAVDNAGRADPRTVIERVVPQDK